MNSPIWSSLMALIFVLALIPACLWLVKSARQMRPGQRGPLQVMHRLALGPREQIAIVRVGSKALLVGVTAQSIQTLCELGPDDLSLDGDQPEDQPKEQVTFATILKRLKKQ